MVRGPGKQSKQWLNENGLKCENGKHQNNQSVVYGTCEEKGCNETYKRPLILVKYSKSGKKCQFHRKGTRRPITFEEFQKFINIIHPQLNIFNFNREDFDKDFIDYNNKINEWTDSGKKEGRPLRQVTAICKKHENHRIKRTWITFFNAGKPPPICNKCKKYGVSQDQIYIMNFIGLILGVHVGHAYNNIDGEHYHTDSKKPLDGFINFNENENDIFNKVKLNNHILNFNIKKRDRNSNYIGWAIEYSHGHWHTNKERDSEKEKEYIKNGYNYITITDKDFKTLQKTKEWKKCLNQMHKSWCSYNITPSSLASRKKNPMIKNEDDMYILSGVKGFMVSTRPKGCDNEKSYETNNTSASFCTLDLFDTDELYKYAKRCQKILLEYVADCTNNTTSRKITFEEKEQKINLIVKEYSIEKRKRNMEQKIKNLNKFKMFNKKKEHIGYLLKLTLGENGNYKKLNKTFITNKNSPIDNYYISLREATNCCILYIKSCYFPDKYRYEYEKYKRECTERSIIEKLCKEEKRDGKLIGIRVCPANNKHLVIKKKTYRFYGKQYHICKTEEECKKMARLFLLSQIYPDKYLKEFLKEEESLIERNKNYKAPGEVFCKVCNRILSNAEHYRRHCKKSTIHKTNLLSASPPPELGRSSPSERLANS